jgi:hypothetical protein
MYKGIKNELQEFREIHQEQGLLIERQKVIDLNRIFAMAKLTWRYQHDIT